MIVWILPHPSQEFDKGPILMHRFGAVTLAYDYETPTGQYEWGELRFVDVLAFRFIEQSACSSEHVSAYDRLLEVEDSQWLGAVASVGDAHRHFRIFFDDVGCYEFLAAGFKASEPGEGPSFEWREADDSNSTS